MFNPELQSIRFSQSNLLTELSGGANDHSDGSLSLLQLLLVHDVHQHRPDEGGRLAAARFGDANDVSAAQGYGDTLSKTHSLLVLPLTLHIL